jgi:hypothetical protein
MEKQVQKLTNDNYLDWSFRIQCLLEDKGIWTIDNEPEQPRNAPAAGSADEAVYNERFRAREAWEVNDTRAFNILALLCDESNINKIRHLRSAKAAFLELRRLHASTSIANQIRTANRLRETTLELGGDMNEHLDKMEKLFVMMSIIDQPLNDHRKVTHILGSLNSDYDGLVSAMGAWTAESLTPQLVKDRIMN